MNESDFAMPSPKRQRTDSPERTQYPSDRNAIHQDVEAVPVQQPIPQDSRLEASLPDQHAPESNSTIPGLESPPVLEENTILDALMQHVESKSDPASSNHVVHDTISHQEGREESDLENKFGNGVISSETCTGGPVLHDSDAAVNGNTVEPSNLVQGSETGFDKNTTGEQMQGVHTEHSLTEDVNGEANNDEEAGKSTEGNGELPPGLPVADTQTIDRLRDVAEVNGLPVTADTIVEEQASQAREWEIDSSPYSSSDSDDSSLSSSSDDSDDDPDEDAEGAYTMMDALEQARILMQDAGSDDEGERSTNRGGVGGLKTANERTEEIVPKPNITVTADMGIEELGCIENIVEGIVLVRATVSGEYQVLESGSLLCLQDRSVIGVIAETLGRVEQPLYTIRFGSDADLKESGVSEKGTKVFYVRDHSTFVFTQPLKAVKGSDASNFHDEEVGDDEMEFSDDEAEAEHKRMLKLKRRGIDPASARGRSPARGNRGSHRGMRGGNRPMQPFSGRDDAAYGNGSLEMNYDDVEEGETGYKPLQRPSNLHEMMSGYQPMELSTSPSYGRGSRGGRGRGRADHRDRRGFRGAGHRGGQAGSAFNANNESSFEHSQNFNQPPMPPPQLAFPPPPPPPALTPQNGTGFPNAPFSPSPISPLPRQGFNFPGFGGNLSAQHQSPVMPPGDQFQQMWQNWQAQQQFQQQHSGWNNGGGSHWQQGQSSGNQQPHYANNAEAVAQVQQHLDELRRASAGNSWSGNGQ